MCGIKLRSKGNVMTYDVGSLCKNVENWRKFKVSKEETKTEVSEARAGPFERLY